MVYLEKYFWKKFEINTGIPSKNSIQNKVLKILQKYCIPMSIIKIFFALYYNKQIKHLPLRKFGFVAKIVLCICIPIT